MESKIGINLVHKKSQQMDNIKQNHIKIPNNVVVDDL